MQIRFYNAKLLTMAEGETLTEGELWVKDGQISYIGPGQDECQETFDRAIDAKGNLLMPGFKNAHTHSAMTVLRSYADDLPLQQWLEEKVFPLEAKLEAQDIYTLSILAVMEYLTSGITANFDMYFHQEQIAKASVDCGFRTVLCGNANDFTRYDMKAAYQKYQNYHSLISYRLGFHAQYTTSLPMLEEIAALANELEAPVYCHNSETAGEVQDCIRQYGKSPTQLFEELGMFAYGGGGFHCVHMDETDLEIFHRRGLSVVTNPGSNSKLASGVAPLLSFCDRGIQVAIGTDGAASNNALDFFREMYLCAVLQKLREKDAAAMDAFEVLKMATVGGARAMGLSDCDVLAPGKQADLIILDLAQPNMQPQGNLIKNIVYSGSKQNVKLTMVAGRVLYEDGGFRVGTDPQEVYAAANRILQRISSGT